MIIGSQESHIFSVFTILKTPIFRAKLYGFAFHSIRIRLSSSPQVTEETRISKTRRQKARRITSVFLFFLACKHLSKGMNTPNKTLKRFFLKNNVIHRHREWILTVVGVFFKPSCWYFVQIKMRHELKLTVCPLTKLVIYPTVKFILWPKRRIAGTSPDGWLLVDSQDPGYELLVESQALWFPITV